MEALSQGPGSHTQNVALEGVGGLGTPGCRLGGAGSSEARAEAEAGRHVLQTEESGAWGGLRRRYPDGEGAGLGVRRALVPLGPRSCLACLEQGCGSESIEGRLEGGEAWLRT